MASQGEQTTLPQPPSSDPAPPSSDPIPSSPAATRNILTAGENACDAPVNPRLAALAAKKATSEQTLADLRAQRAAIIAKATLPSGLAMPEDWSEEQKTKQALTSANAVIKEHIGLLHKYNEMRDIGQGLMGLIADQRGVRIAEVMEEFGVGAKD